MRGSSREGTPYITLTPGGSKSRVGGWRGGRDGPALSTHFIAGAAVPRPRLRFQPPLIKPGMRFSRTRLSEAVHRVAIGAAGCQVTVPLSRYTPTRRKNALV